MKDRLLPWGLPVVILVGVLLLAGWMKQSGKAADGQFVEGPHVVAASSVEAGKYLVTIGGCNDCHTPQWNETNGDVPEEDWLIGKAYGFRGPWGTTYPGNLRIFFEKMTEDQWVTFASQWHARPPMPSMNLHKMAESDLRAMYAYITSLEVKGDPAPDYLPPHKEPATPYAILAPYQGQSGTGPASNVSQQSPPAPVVSQPAGALD